MFFLFFVFYSSQVFCELQLLLLLFVITFISLYTRIESNLIFIVFIFSLYRSFSFFVHHSFVHHGHVSSIESFIMEKLNNKRTNQMKSIESHLFNRTKTCENPHKRTHTDSETHTRKEINGVYSRTDDYALYTLSKFQKKILQN